MLVTLGVLSILIAAGLAGFGLLGIQRQLEARKHVVVLEQALWNHTNADTFMDDVRTDVLRALQNAVGTNKEGRDAIRAELEHHVGVLRTAIAENLTLSLSPELHGSYIAITGLITAFVPAGHNAVELALTDPVAGAANFERFRQSFSPLEELMDSVRVVVHDEVQHVRDSAVQTAKRAKHMIVASSLAGIMLLILITAVAVRIAQGIM